MRKFYLIYTLIFVFAIMSCRKKTTSPPGPTPVQVEEIINSSDPAQPVITIPTDNTLLPTRSLHNFIFDWEQANTMPVIPGNPAVPMPWSDQAVRNYDAGLRYDFKKADGWEIVYNNFSDSINFDNRFFILYNKFRGLLRYYCYNSMPSNPGVDSYRSLINQISLVTLGVNSHMLNFSGQYIVDLNANASSVSLIEPWPISMNGWYISQFEMAFDQDIRNYTYQQIVFLWVYAFARTEELTLNNKSASGLELYLQKQNVRFTENSSRGVPISGDMQLQMKSVNGFDDLDNVFSGSVISTLKQTITDTAAGNFLNATLVPSLGIADCKLDVPATLRLDQNLVGFVPGMSLAIPGMNNSNVVGFGPVFNEPVGIFYLAHKPVIHHAQIAGALTEQYTLDKSSIEYIINPFIQNYAVVRNFRQEIVAINAEEEKNLTEAKIFRGQVLKASAPLNVLGVRVSFEVAPKNGSAVVKIVKTFKADVAGD